MGMCVLYCELFGGVSETGMYNKYDGVIGEGI